MVLDPPWLSRLSMCTWSRELHMNINDINLTAWCLEQSLYNLNVFVLYLIKELFFFFTFFPFLELKSYEISCYLWMTTIIPAFSDDIFIYDISMRLVDCFLSTCLLSVDFFHSLWFRILLLKVKKRRKKRKTEPDLS